MGSTFSSPKKISVVHVHFNKKKLRVALGPEDYNSEKRVPLRQFRLKLAKALDVPATSLVLYQLKPQKKLGNMGSTLEEYGIKNGGDILAVQTEDEVKKEAPPPADKRIDQIVQEVDTQLGDRISKFVASPPADSEERETENRILCETILAKTIALDNVEVKNVDERTKRKQAIAKLQEYHNRIDQAMQASKAKDAQAGAVEQPPANVQNEVPAQQGEPVAVKEEAAKETVVDAPAEAPVQKSEPATVKEEAAKETVADAPAEAPVQKSEPAAVKEEAPKETPAEAPVQNETQEPSPSQVEPTAVGGAESAATPKDAQKAVEEPASTSTNAEVTETKAAETEAAAETGNDSSAVQKETTPSSSKNTAAKKKKNNKKKNKRR